MNDSLSRCCWVYLACQQNLIEKIASKSLWVVAHTGQTGNLSSLVHFVRVYWLNFQSLSAKSVSRNNDKLLDDGSILKIWFSLIGSNIVSSSVLQCVCVHVWRLDCKKGATHHHRNMSAGSIFWSGNLILIIIIWIFSFHWASELSSSLKPVAIYMVKIA